ncbi:MAG: hypothetical protein WHX52_18475 [Anaerolineae bacterium]
MSITDTNRALEFLHQAQKSFPVLHDKWGWKSKQFVELAIAEVQELLDRIAELEARETFQSCDGILIVSNIVTRDVEHCPTTKKRL